MVKYPYLPEGRTILYVPANNKFMKLAREFAEAQSYDKYMPGAAVVVKDGRVIGIHANGSDWHEKHGCERKRQNIPTGQRYDLCPEGCGPKNHSEVSAIRDAALRQESTVGADLYLWGHWWCCADCWNGMIEAGIANVFLMENSEVLFNREHPHNIVGRQFNFPVY